nr:unnamed protein product [Digitaria exilis]
MELAEQSFSLLGSYALPLWATITAGVFVVVSLSLSLYLLFNHLSAYKNPEEQKFLVGVILMVPCYAVESYISLVNPSISVDIEILRDGYEAFAMYCFGRYLVACLGGEDRTIEFLKKEGGSGSDAPLLGQASEQRYVHHPFPMNYMLKPWPLGEWFYLVIKFGLVQYMIIKSICAILAVILESFGVYCEGEFKLSCGFQVFCTSSPVMTCNFHLTMGVASVVHLYVFPAKPYELMGDRFIGDVSVLGDYASVDCPLDPDEVKDSERPTKFRLPQPDDHVRCSTGIKESVRDVVLGGGEYIVNDLKFTVNHAVEPINEKLHMISQNIKKHEKGKKKTNDDSCISSPTSFNRVISGIDDPLLNGSLSDNSGPKKARRHRRKSGYTSAESGGESSDHGLGGYEIRGHRWITRE